MVASPPPRAGGGGGEPKDSRIPMVESPMVDSPMLAGVMDPELRGVLSKRLSITDANTIVAGSE